MVKRLLALLLQTIRNVFTPSISVLSRVEASEVHPKAKVWRFAKLYHSKVGAYSYIGPNCSVVYASIGKFCSIAGNARIGMGSHPLHQLSTSSIFIAGKNGTGSKWVERNTFNEYSHITVGNDVWIGSEAMVMGGVTIGDGAIIGARAVVTKDVPPYAIVAGVPARIIRFRFTESQINLLSQLRWWDLPTETIRQNINLFSQNVTDEVIDSLRNLQSY